MPLRIVVLAAVSTKVQSKEDRHSLPIQEADGRAFAAREGGSVVDVLRVPGHTRRILDFAELRERARRKGIDAFVRLEEHWRAKDFDVLWVRGGDRFARTQSVHARITEEIINAGARIFAADDGGWVDKSNYRYWIAMSGAKAAGSVDNLVTMTRKTKDEKAAIGLAINSRPIWSHKVVRNDLGRIVAVAPDETKRLIIEDAARLVIEGVGWHSVEGELHRRYGHTNDGKPFGGMHFYSLFHNPYFWGHSARRWKSYDLNRTTWDTWVFGPSTPPPDGVLIHYHTHAPYLSSELGDRLKAELLRRRSSVRGANRPYRSRWFSGLLVCGECFYFMNWTDNGHGTGYYRCTPATGNRRTARPCSGQFVREDKVQAWLEDALREQLAASDPYFFFQSSEPPDDAALIRKAIEDVRTRARALITKQASADPSLGSLYDEQIQAAGVELRALQARLLEAEQDEARDERAAAERAYEELRALPDPSTVWTWEKTRVNQFFHALMGRHRVLLVKGEPKRIIRR